MNPTSLALSFALLAAAMLPNPIAAQTPSPAMPTCAAGDPVVWFNTRSHAYHRSGDAYYGTTKHGRYACESEARAKGGHLAAATHGRTNAAQSPSPGSTSATPARHHRHHRIDGTPAPAAT